MTLWEQVIGPSFGFDLFCIISREDYKTLSLLAFIPGLLLFWLRFY